MKAAILHKGAITIGDMPIPEPGQGQVLIRTHRCPLCASDQHFMCSGHEIVAQSRTCGGPYAQVDPTRI